MYPFVNLGAFPNIPQVGDCGLSTVREHTVVYGGVHGPGKGVLKRPELQNSSTSHRGKPIYKVHINFISWKNTPSYQYELYHLNPLISPMHVM